MTQPAADEGRATLSEFRAEVRDWLIASCPESMRTRPASDAEDVWGGRNGVFPSEDAKLWMERAANRGFTAPRWPVRFGGAGLSQEQARVVREEMRALSCRIPLKSFGIWMLGPVLLTYATEEQKLEYLPGIARGDTRWCQGYSEPGAGSDLASLSMRAIPDSDDYLVTGQKIWTSHADKADFMFCLVRTDVSAKKQAGISFILVDMRTPGISVQPIQLISGASPFCETFFDNVRVPQANRIGPENGGWEIAKALLLHEREAISSLRDAASSEEEPLAAVARRYDPAAGGTAGEGKLRNATLRARIAEIDMDFLCNQLTLKRVREAAEQGGPAGDEPLIFKLVATEINKRRRELLVTMRGFRGLGWEGDGFTSEELGVTRDWLRSRANSIEGGSSEIQLNIIAKRALGLPD